MGDAVDRGMMNIAKTLRIARATLVPADLLSYTASECVGSLGMGVSQWQQVRDRRVGVRPTVEYKASVPGTGARVRETVRLSLGRSMAQVTRTMEGYERA